jgi:predicted PurR-regulated permease PerM
MNKVIPEGKLTTQTVRPLSASDLLKGPLGIRSIALTGLFVLALFYTIYFTRSILLPLVLALFVSYLLRPVRRALGRLKIAAPIAAAVILLILVGCIGFGISFLAAPANAWLQTAPASLQKLQQKLLPLRRHIERAAQANAEIEKIATPADAQTKTVIEVKQHPLIEMLYVRTPQAVMNVVLLLILLYFLLAYDGAFLPKLIRLMPRLEDKKRAVLIAREIEWNISQYLLTVAVINACLGLAVGIIVGLLGLPNPAMWGVLVAVLNFVPYLGALTGITGMTLGSVLSFDSLGYALIFPAVYLTLVTIEANLITPLVMGKSFTLNPVIILLSLTLWGWMWGIVGIILAVPILAVFKIFCAHIEPLKPVAEFLS